MLVNKDRIGMYMNAFPIEELDEVLGVLYFSGITNGPCQKYIAAGGDRQFKKFGAYFIDYDTVEIGGPPPPGPARRLNAKRKSYKTNWEVRDKAVRKETVRKAKATKKKRAAIRAKIEDRQRSLFNQVEKLNAAWIRFETSIVPSEKFTGAEKTTRRLNLIARQRSLYKQVEQFNEDKRIPTRWT